MPTIEPPFQTGDPSPNASSDPSSLPITLSKGKRTCTSHPISHYVSYPHLSPSFPIFTSSVSYMVIPKSMKETLSIPGWMIMEDEMATLLQNGTWLLFLQESIVLVFVGYTMLNIYQMVHFFFFLAEKQMVWLSA